MTCCEYCLMCDGDKCLAGSDKDIFCGMAILEEEKHKNDENI